MYIGVQRIISCEKLLQQNINEFEPCKVVISKDLPIDIVLDVEIYRHKTYEYIRDNEQKIVFRKCNEDSQLMTLNEITVIVEKNNTILQGLKFDDKPNWGADSKYTRAGYSVERGIYAKDRLKILFKMSDECGRNLSNDFEAYCWFIENKRSNGKVYYANRRRRRDLAALKYYESHNGEKKFVEDYGNDR